MKNYTDRVELKVQATGVDLPDVLTQAVETFDLAGKVTVGNVFILCDGCNKKTLFNLLACSLPAGWVETVNGMHYCPVCS